MLLFFSLLLLLLLLLSGAEDAHGSILSCVCTRALSPTNALWLVSLCRFLGTLLIPLFRPRVAFCVSAFVDLGEDPAEAFSVLCAGLCAAILWTLFLRRLHLPSSTLHALLSGILGASVGQNMNLDGVHLASLWAVLVGVFLSTLPTFLLARFFYFAIHRFCADFERRRMMRGFRRTQILSAIGSTLLQGAQSAQTYLGVFLLGLSLFGKGAILEEGHLTLPILIPLASFMALGTLLGGGKTLQKVGGQLARPDAFGGSAANMAASAVLCLATLCGVPISTTYSKASAMMGVGSSDRNGTNPHLARQLLATWLSTYPVCLGAGFLLAHLFL